MNAERLLALYEKVAEAPDAIARLRRFVLGLAVRGKLVAQDPAGVPPAKVLAQARRDLRAQAETAKRIRWKQTDPVSDDEVDKHVPSSWVAARVNDTGLYINGLAFKPADWMEAGIPIIRIQNLTDPVKEFNYAEGDFPDEVMVRDGDLLVSWSATLEAFKWDRGEGVLNQHIFRVIPHEGLTDRGFLLLLLRHAIREMADSEHAHGLVMTHINRGPFLNHVVLIPPLAEQRRIVAKVDELMALLDRLEVASTTREAIRDRLTATSLERLTAPDTTLEVFPAHARFAIDVLPALTSRTDQIKSLRQTILNLAVRGKLVPQESSDESVRLNWEPEPADLPFELPKNWRWIRIGAQLDLLNGIAFKPTDWVSSGVPIVRIQNLNNPDAPFNYCRPEMARDRSLIDDGSFLISWSGTPGTSFGAFIWARGPAVLNQHIFRCDFKTSFFDPQFLKLAVNGRLDEMIAKAHGGVGLQHITKGKLEAMLIPLPPLAEQQRIVAKVDELMALCDRLEASLATEDTKKKRLLEALLRETLEPTLKEAA